MIRMAAAERIARLRTGVGSPATHAVVLAAFALAAWLPYGFRAVPITGDRAYFTYLGQAVLRGEPIYATTFMGYPPLGMLLSGAAMWVGRCFELPSYLAPRYAAVAVGALCSVLVYALTRRATGSAWAGLLAGVALASFDRWGLSVLSTLEPKHLVVLFAWPRVSRCRRDAGFSQGSQRRWPRAAGSPRRS